MGGAIQLRAHRFVDGCAKQWLGGDLQLSSAVLEYRVCFATEGTHYGNIYRIPTLNGGKGKSCEIAIGVMITNPT